MKVITKYFTLRNLAILGVLVVVDCLLSYLVLYAGVDLYHENGFMENTQWVLLAFCCLTFLLTAIRLDGRERIFAAFFAMLCFIFIFREIDFEKLPVPEWVIFLLADNRGRAIFFLVDLVFLGMMARDYRHYLQHWKTYLHSDLYAYIILCAGFLIVFSTAFEHRWIFASGHHFFEELSELTAYYFLLAASLISVKELALLRHLTARRPD